MSDFQHRHYARIAKMLYEATPNDGIQLSSARKLHAELIEKFANMFANDNSRFDRRRFMEAASGKPRGKDADSGNIARVAGRPYL